MSVRPNILAVMLMLAMAAPLPTLAAPPRAAPGVQREVCDSAVVTGPVLYVSLSGNDTTGDGTPRPSLSDPEPCRAGGGGR